MTFDADQTIGAGQDNYVLTYDNAAGIISLEVAPGAGGGDAWSDAVDADIVPDADGTRDLGATATRFAETYTDALDVTNNIVVGGTVDGRDIAADGTTLDDLPVSNLANGTDGELITWDASGAPTTVAVGTSGHVLTSNGAGAAPTFQAAAGGSGAWTALATASASASASVTFTSGFTSTYDSYVIQVRNIAPATDAVFLRLRCSTDGGSSYLTTGYDSAALEGMHVSDATQELNNVTTYFPLNVQDATEEWGSGTAEIGCLNIWLYNMASASVRTQFMADGYHHNEAGQLARIIALGHITTAAAHDAVEFTFDSGNISTGEFTLFGINHS
jgi:hypothetical protein